MTDDLVGRLPELHEIAETVAKALNRDRDMRLNPLYMGDPAWTVAVEVQDTILAALARKPPHAD